MEIISFKEDWLTSDSIAGSDLNRIEQNITMCRDGYRMLEFTGGRFIKKETSHYSFYERTVYSQYLKIEAGYRLTIRKLQGAFVEGEESVADNYTPMDTDNFLWQVWLRPDATDFSNPATNTDVLVMEWPDGINNYYYDIVNQQSGNYYENTTQSDEYFRIDFAVCQDDDINNDVIGFANLQAVITFEPI